MTVHILRSDDGETVERTDAPIFEGGRVWGRSLTGSHSTHVSVQVVQFGRARGPGGTGTPATRCSTSSQGSARWGIARAIT